MTKQQRKKLPSQQALLDLLSYDKDTGLLTWRERTPEIAKRHGLDEKLIDIWNSNNAGKPAHTLLRRGYIGITAFGIHYFAHRIIWKMIFDEEPDHVDHINGNTSDNRLENLRNVDAQGNSRNRKLSSNNKTGYSGVHWCSDRQKFVARIKINRRNISLGAFSLKEDAIEARRQAEKSIDFVIRQNA